MNSIERLLDRATEMDMEQVVEPLASYICASDHPNASLLLAVETLYNQVARTNREASDRVAAVASRLADARRCRAAC
jgi:hypothetical protein